MVVPQHGPMDFVIKYLTPGTVVHFTRYMKGSECYFAAKISPTVEYPVYLDKSQPRFNTDRTEFEGEIIEVRRYPYYVGLIVKQL